MSWTLSWCLFLFTGHAPGSHAPGSGQGDEGTLWIRAERVIVRPGTELENAVLRIEEGRVVAVGTDLLPPEGAEVIEGAVACPGFVDPWSSLGLSGQATTELGTNAATRTVDAHDPWHLPHERREAWSGGVTSARVQGGVSALFGGVGAVLRTDPDPDARVVILEDACLAATVGVTRGPSAGDVFDRAAEIERLVAALEKGQRYRTQMIEYRHDLAEWEEAIAEKREELEKDFKKAKKKRDKEIEEAEEKGKEFKEERYKEDKKPSPPRFDEIDEVVSRVAEGELPLVVEVHRAEEIHNLLSKTEDLDRLRLVLAGATEAAAFAEELAERDVPVIVWPVPMGADKQDEHDAHDLSLAGELQRAGVEVLIGSGGGPHARELRHLAALAVGHGMDARSALHAITTGPARTFDVSDRVGSLEQGSDADVLLFDGDPLDSTSRLVAVVSRGRVVGP